MGQSLMNEPFYDAATKASAVVEKAFAGIVKFTGSERAAWLQGMLTNDVVKLQPGQGCYSAHLTPQGKMVAQMYVFADSDALWMELERSSIQDLIAALDKYLIMEDVQMADVSGEFVVFSFLGPGSKAVIEKWLGQPLNLAGFGSHVMIGGYRVAAVDLGYDAWVPREKSTEVRKNLLDCGVSPADHATWDILRVEAGIPVYGVDIDETTTMPELGERGIDYGKGCYIGQEVVAKVKYIGHVNRRFVGLNLSGPELPPPKSPIRKGGKEAGTITTALYSPGLKRNIALGFVHRVAHQPGTEVEVLTKNASISATIVDLPFKAV